LEVIDQHHIEQLGGLDSPEIREILEEFLGQLDEVRHELIASLHDRDAFREKAHSLKGAALMSGFAEIGEQAASYESLARGGEPLPEADTLDRELTDLTARTRAAYQEAIAGL
jgi:HPt (histidine-containing phosphotransfer) domain-containing protein